MSTTAGKEIVRASEAQPDGRGWTLSMVRRFEVATGRQDMLPRLNLISTATPQQFTTLSVNADHLPFWELAPAIRALDAAGKPTDQLVAKLNHKISGPLSAAGGGCGIRAGTVGQVVRAGRGRPCPWLCLFRCRQFCDGDGRFRHLSAVGCGLGAVSAVPAGRRKPVVPDRGIASPSVRPQK